MSHPFPGHQDVPDPAHVPRLPAGVMSLELTRTEVLSLMTCHRRWALGAWQLCLCSPALLSLVTRQCSVKLLCGKYDTWRLNLRDPNLLPEAVRFLSSRQHSFKTASRTAVDVQPLNCRLCGGGCGSDGHRTVHAQCPNCIGSPKAGHKHEVHST